MNMTTVLFGSVISAVGVQNFHPAISGLHLANSNPEVGELAVRMTAGRIAALVAGRVRRRFWICRREGRDGHATNAEETRTTLRPDDAALEPKGPRNVRAAQHRIQNLPKAQEQAH